MSYIIPSEFYCTNCAKKGIPIARKKSRAKEAGHLKKLYCLNCKRETNHVETKEWSHYTFKDFLFEFNNDNFNEIGNRRMEYGLFRAKMNKEGVELP